MTNSFRTALLALVAFIASATQAHMILQNPVPYGVDTINNSPLENSFPGDYPCKQRSGVYDMPPGGYNKFAVGSRITASFKGSAVHGGGSCQFAITTDQHPTAKSTFKVIYSVVGGCPEGPVSFTVPPELPTGKYTLAWTWFNKIGNREMYMNCAPIEVSGGADNVDALMKLPDMYTLNIPNTQCESEDSKDLVFPQPGKYKTTAASAALATAGPSGSGCKQAVRIGAGAGKVTMPAGGSSGSGAGGNAANAAAPLAPGPTQPPAYGASSSGFVTSVRPASSAAISAPAQAPASANLPSAYSLPTAFGPSASPSSAAAGAASSATAVSSQSSASFTASSSSSTFSTLTLSAASSSSSPSTSSTKLTVSTAAPSAGTALPPPMASSAAPYPIVGVSPSASSAAGVAAPTSYNNPYGGSGSGSSGGSGSIGSSGASAGSASGGGSASIDTCESDGVLLCNGPTKFGLCNHGKVLWQDVAAGTKCVGGQIV